MKDLSLGRDQACHYDCLIKKSEDEIDASVKENDTQSSVVSIS